MTEVNTFEDDSKTVETTFDDIASGIEEIKNLMHNVTMKPKTKPKKASKKLPEDFDWNLIDNFILAYFNGDIEIDEKKQKPIQVDNLFIAFKSFNPTYKLADMKYQFKKRCGILCDVSSVVFGIKPLKEEEQEQEQFD